MQYIPHSFGYNNKARAINICVEIDFIDYLSLRGKRRGGFNDDHEMLKIP